MKVAIQSTALQVRRQPELFRLAAESGADGIEMVYPTPKDAKALSRPEHAAELKQLADEHRLPVAALNLGWLREQPSLIGKPPVIAGAQAEIAEVLPVAARIGAPVVLLPFLGKNAIELETELDVAVDALAGLVEPAEEAGVTLGIESALIFDQVRFLLDGLGHTGNIKICYDTGRALARKTDVAMFIRDLGGEAIAQVHFSDVRMGQEGAPPDFNVQLGEGDVDFPAVMQALRAVNCDGWIVLETPLGDDPLGSAKSNLAFVRKLLGDTA